MIIPYPLYSASAQKILIQNLRLSGRVDCWDYAHPLGRVEVRKGSQIAPKGVADLLLKFVAQTPRNPQTDLLPSFYMPGTGSPPAGGADRARDWRGAKQPRHEVPGPERQ
jgi:hypothetical protein